MVGGAVVRVVMAERADERELIGLLAELRQVIAQVHAGDFGAGGLKLAAELGGGVRLQVERVDGG